jgi:hypothetical protein
MKLTRILIGIALLAVLALPTAGSFAQIATYSSCFQVQNLEGQLATIVITFYARAGGTPTTVNDTINANSSKTYCPLPVAAGFDGSVVISSDREVAAITNVFSTDGLDYYASYTGFQAGSGTALLPLLMKGNFGFNTWFHVQNTGTANTNVTVTYSDGAAAAACNNLEPGRACKFDQASEPHAAGWVGSATVTASGGQSIAVTVMEVGPTTLFSYDGFTGGANNPVMPLINANNFGYITGIQIFNSGSAATDVTVSYTPSSAGSACTETQNVPAGQSRTFALQAFSAGGACGAQTFVGSGRVSANSASQPLAAIVNQLNQSANKGAAYNAFNPASGTSMVVMPLIMDRNFGYFTGFSVTNVGSAATTVTCTFTNSSRTVSGTLQPGQALTDVQLNQLANGYVGSATCTAPGGQIVGIVNELATSGAGDAFLVYEGTNN